MQYFWALNILLPILMIDDTIVWYQKSVSIHFFWKTLKSKGDEEMLHFLQMASDWILIDCLFLYPKTLHPLLHLLLYYCIFMRSLFIFIQFITYSKVLFVSLSKSLGSRHLIMTVLSSANRIIGSFACQKRSSMYIKNRGVVQYSFPGGHQILSLWRLI